jgi:polysaccharide export outer membrane protein
MRPSALIIGALVTAACAGHGVDPMPVQPVTQVDSGLRPGDVLRITVWRQPDFSGEFPINADSTVAHPLLQAVRVVGVPLSVVRTRLRDFFLAYEQNPRFVLEPLYPVVVAGEVRAPGLFAMPRGTTVSQAVARGGGPTDRGQLDRVTLIRGGKSYALNLLRDDRRIAVMPIGSGDQLFVGRRSDFNAVRDVLSPIASVAAAVAAVLVYSRR